MKCFMLIVMIFVFCFSSFSQTDTLYVYSGGNILFQEANYNVDSIITDDQNDSVLILNNMAVIYSNKVSQIDSIIFYNASNPPFICGLDYVYDIDGNAYRTIQLGNQCWMRENLKVTKYPNADSIPYVVSDYEWTILGNNAYADAMCYYNNDTLNKDIYGALYTHSAATAVNWTCHNQAGQGICPDGWHLPTDDEWKELELYVGMSQNEVDNNGMRGLNEGSIISADKLLWQNDVLVFNPDFESSGFDALPAGNRNGTVGIGGFMHLHTDTQIWTASSIGGNAYHRRIQYDNTGIIRNTPNKSYGFSVICVKD